jgi:hypothetical protein
MGPLELAIILLVWVLPAYLVARYAQRKGHSFGAFLLLGLLVSWAISFIIAVVLQDKRDAAQEHAAAPAPNRVEDLTRLAQLRDSGALSDDEFQAEKTRLLAGH